MDKESSYKDRVKKFLMSPSNLLLIALLLLLLALLITMIVYVATPIPKLNVQAEKYHIIDYRDVCDKLKVDGVQQYDFHIDIMPNTETPNYIKKSNITNQMKKTFDAWTTDNWVDATKQLASDLNSLLTTQTYTYVRVRAQLYYDVVKEDYVEFEHFITNKSADSITWATLSNL